MVDRSLIREFSVSDTELEETFDGALQEMDADGAVLDLLYDQSTSPFDVNQIIEGTVVRVEGEEVIVDIGYKSEGLVPTDEWIDDDGLPKVGDKIQVLLEEVEDNFGLIILSKRKADRIREWERIIATHQEGDVVTGTVVRKIKGGLLVNIGVNVFLPASQVDIRRPHDIGDFIGQDIECVILKIDESRRNIVVSRRKLIEDKREKLKKRILDDICEGELRKGIVKNIADFGAFVDLGGIDGLLHITDMSWGRISHPSDMVRIDDEIEVMILSVDQEREKIALGLKQKTPSPWESVEEKYPVGSKITGTVVNVMSYGAFVKLEEGIEGLVHISEMSWTKRINHPTELVNINDEVEVVVLGINKEKQEISLGMKQATPDPWANVLEKYPPGSSVSGTVRNLTNYGAFIELEEGVDGLLHVSDMSWTRKISHASEMLKRGDTIECQVVSVDEERRRIALGLKQMREDPWEREIPTQFAPGSIVTGKVTKLTNFGVFVELATELEGLLHISELADHKVENPEDVVRVGEEIEVRVLRVDTDDRKIGLSRKLMDADTEDEVIQEKEAATPRAVAPREELKGGTDSGASGPLFSFGGGAAVPETQESEELPAEPDASVDTAEEPAAEASDETPSDDSPVPEEQDEESRQSAETEVAEGSSDVADEAPTEEPAQPEDTNI